MARAVFGLFLVLRTCCGTGTVGGLPSGMDISLLEPGGLQCKSDIATLRQGLDTRQLWAIKMWDANVKAPTALLSRTGIQFGDFDQCLSIKDPIIAQYCLVDISPAQPNTSQWTPFKWAVCVPRSCSPSELQSALQALMAPEAEGVVVGKIIPEYCTTKDTASPPFTRGDQIFCLIIVCILALVCAATVHDVMTTPSYEAGTPPKTPLECMSARRGWYSILRVEQPVCGLNLRPLYGLHSLTFFTVVLGHRFGVHLFFVTLINYSSIENMFTDSWVLSIWNCHADLFVDIFFFMSSFLLSTLYTAELQKHYVSPVKVYIARIVRYYPLYIIVIAFYSTLFRHIADGPIWNLIVDSEHGNCKEYWWANLLFINNYIHSEHLCIPQTWYITCEMQLFVLGTILVLLLHRSPRVGMAVVGTLFIVSTILPFLSTYYSDLPAFLLFYKEFWVDVRNNKMFNSVYSQFHYRGTSYLPGLMAGVFVHTRKNNPLSKGHTYTMQALGFGCSLVVYWSGFPFYNLSSPPGRLVSALYASVFHSFFGLGLALFTISMVLGTPTFVSQFLSWKGFVPLSKLSFCVFLIHLLPQLLWLGSSRVPVYFTAHELISWTIADILLCLAVALVLSLTVETPARYLFKSLTSGPPKQLQNTMGVQDLHKIEDIPQFVKTSDPDSTR